MKRFHKISVTMNQLIFREAEFAHLFLYTINVNNKIHFHQNSWNQSDEHIIKRHFWNMYVQIISLEE